MSGPSATPASPPGGRPGFIEVIEADEPLGIGPGTDILIVDDDPSNLVAYEAALSALGRRLVPAGSGVSALGKLLEQDFALLLLDVSMPEMNGIETARRIRQRPRNKGLPIIFITGASSSTEVVLEAYDVGACDFVIKPILPEVLRAKARVYLQLQERTHETIRQAVQLREAQQRLDEAEEKIREREAAAATAHKLEKLQEATAALSKASTPAEVAAVTVRLGTEAIHATGATMWVARPDGSYVIEGSYGIPETYLEQFRVIEPGSRLAIWRVLEGRPLWVEDPDDYARESPETFDVSRAAGRLAAFAALPMMLNGRNAGIVTFAFDGVHRFNEQQRNFITALVRASEQALERARLYVAEADARRAAETANQRKDVFLAMLSHELRNPLWTMVNALQLLKNQVPPSRDHVALIEHQVDHLKHMIEDLLDVSRITQGKIALKREPVLLEEVIGDALALARPLIDRHEHRIDVRVADDLVLDADRYRARQVIENLLTNAAKYTPPGGRIEVEAALAGAFVRIAVKDNGRGIPSALLPTLFDLFVQGERTLDRSEGGLGIGLTLVRSVVQLHGGTVDVHSDGLGTGATFIVQWPRSASAPRPSTVAPAVAPTLAPRALRVLLVDDNAEAATLLGTLLESFGYEILIAHDGATAVGIAHSHAPDVALVDIGLPVMDGYEVAMRLREIPGCARTLLVALTGYGQTDDVERATRAGFAHHFVKPVELATLTGLLEQRASTLD